MPKWAYMGGSDIQLQTIYTGTLTNVVLQVLGMGPHGKTLQGNSPLWAL